MTIELDNPDFWNDRADYRGAAHDFTSFYSERAWSLADVPHGAKVLDIAAGAGALALVAAREGADVLATDFSAAMVAAIRAHELPDLRAEVMDGHALGIPDATFDAAFSMFGIMLFADWRKGLAEMSRVLRPGGIACVGTWKDPSGAAANLLLAEMVARRIPDAEQPTPVTGMNALRDPARFRAALEDVGIRGATIHEVSSDFVVESEALLEPDRLFQFSPVWPLLDARQRATILADMRDLAQRNDGVIRVASPALIGVGHRQ
jgi:SAM-dependent methyltransferase